MSPPILDGSPRRALATALVLLVCACIPIPVGSRVSLKDRLPDALPISPGESVAICGEDAPPPPCSKLSPYFTGGCTCLYRRDLVAEVRARLLEVNPTPGRFAVHAFYDAAAGAPPGDEAGAAVFGRYGISDANAAALRVRYVVHVREILDTTVYVPLYVIPFGIAFCTFGTVIEADVLEAPTGRDAGSLTVTANGEFFLAAWLLHVVVWSDTQADARRRLAEELAARLTGVRP